MEMVSFASHDWALHLDCLCERLARAPLARRVVVTHGPLVKNAVFNALVERMGVAFGIKVLDLASAMEYFHQLCGTTKEKMTPSKGLLTVHLETLLRCEPPEEIASYLAGKEGRIRRLAERVATLFLRYGKYGGEGLAPWEKKKGWIQRLWRAVRGTWLFPCDHNPKRAPFPVEVHLFCLPFIPTLYQKELARLSTQWPIYTYYFSFCGEYWEDLESEKGRIGLEHADVGHPLLGNFGALGRKMFSFYQTEGDEAYPLPDPKTLLASLRSDIVQLVETPCETDRSLQLHATPTRRMEVEALSKTLLTLLADDPTLHAEDIVIYAPDIAAYAPYIKGCFGRSSAPLGYRIDGLPVASQSPFFQSLLALFHLAESRWHVEDILPLFHFRPLCDKFGIEVDDIPQIREWVEIAAIRWGMDGEHRARILGEEEEQGTWEEGIHFLLRHLADTIELSNAPLLGKLSLLFESLRDDLAFLRNEQLSPATWARFVDACAKAYFVPDERGEALLSRGLKELRSLETAPPCPFGTIYRFLTRLGEARGGVAEEGDVKIRFESLVAGNVSPSRVIGCLGMEEGAFPRRRTFDHFDTLDRKDPEPDPSEEDRHAALELLFSAQDVLFFSYTALCPKDGKEVAPSLIVSEIGRALARKGANFFRVEHPALSFDPRYFSESHYPQSFSLDEYRAAEIRYGEKKSLPLFPEWYEAQTPPTLDKEKEIVVSIASLIKAVRNPFQLYCNETLGIYAQKKERFDREGEFVLSPLTRYQCKVEGGVPRALPLGPFRSVAERQIASDADALRESFSTLNIDPDDLFTLHLSSHCDAPERSGNHWTVPALTVPLPEGRCATLVGTIEGVCEKGVVSWQKKGVRATLSLLPKVAVWAALPGREEAFAFFLDGARSKPVSHEKGIALLQKLVLYYEEVVARGSPLHPDLLSPLRKESQPLFDKAFAAESVDLYLTWVAKTQPPFAVSTIAREWKEWEEFLATF